MIDADAFVERALAEGFDFFTGTPCSHLRSLIDAAIGHPRTAWYDAPNEGDAVALAAGARLGGRRGVVLFQNSGLGNAVNALTSLCEPFRIPVLLIVSRRGDPDGPPDEPQHRVMGRITPDLLDAMEIGWETLPPAGPEAADALARARARMDADGRPYALVVPKGRFLARPAGGAGEGVARTRSTPEPGHPPPRTGAATGAPPLRAEVLRALLRHERERDVVVATTGYTGRELHALSDGPNRLYMVGSMGSASVLGLGIALARPERRVVVIDGDGAVLMRMGNLAAVGAYAPDDFLHVVLDNGVHESTGGQTTLSPGVDLASVAAACGYRSTVAPVDLAAAERVFAAPPPGPCLVWIRTGRGTLPELGRPDLGPSRVRERLEAELRRTADGTPSRLSPRPPED